VQHLLTRAECPTHLHTTLISGVPADHISCLQMGRSGYKDVDYVLTTRELGRLFRWETFANTCFHAYSSKQVAISCYSMTCWQAAEAAGAMSICWYRWGRFVLQHWLRAHNARAGAAVQVGTFADACVHMCLYACHYTIVQKKRGTHKGAELQPPAVGAHPAGQSNTDL
jgi:hypothetical protein